MKFGFYSEKAAKHHGHSIYSDINGDLVKVTFVTNDPITGYYSYKWDDKVFVGTLNKFIVKSFIHDKYLDYKRHSLRARKHLPWN